MRAVGLMLVLLSCSSCTDQVVPSGTAPLDGGNTPDGGILFQDGPSPSTDFRIVIIELGSSDTNSIDDGTGPMHDGQWADSLTDAPSTCNEPCDDGDPCTHNDRCQQGACQGDPYVCDDGDHCTADSCQGDGTCDVVPILPCEAGYALSGDHPSGNIASTSNRLVLSSLTLTAAGWETTRLVDLGSFKGEPTLWDYWYEQTDPPQSCHDRLLFYQNTPFEGLSERFFVGTSKADLVQRLRARLTETFTHRAASNFAGGDLCQPDNFWTEMKVFAAGISHIEAELNKL